LWRRYVVAPSHVVGVVDVGVDDDGVVDVVGAQRW
jgi:hypothetical protein